MENGSIIHRGLAPARRPLDFPRLTRLPAPKPAVLALTLFCGDGESFIPSEFQRLSSPRCTFEEARFSRLLLT